MPDEDNTFSGSFSFGFENLMTSHAHTLARRARIMTSDGAMFKESEKGPGMEHTLLLISQYREHEKLFRKVNCKKKSVWELITAENPNFSARPEQFQGKWKSSTLAFRKCCDHNSISEND